MNCSIHYHPPYHSHHLSNKRHSKYSNATTNNNDIDKDIFYPLENICPDDSDLSFKQNETMNSTNLHRYYSRRTPMRARLNQFKILHHYNNHKRLQNRLVLPNQTCKLSSSDKKQQHQQQQQKQQSLRSYRNRVLRILHDKHRVKFYEERELIKKFSDVDHIDDDDDDDDTDNEDDADGGHYESDEKDEYYYHYHQDNEADTVSIEAVTKDNNDTVDEDVDAADDGICDKHVEHGENSVYAQPVNECNLTEVTHEENNKSEEHLPDRINEETVK
ncbi:unnamed protein product [Trichobilharzia szidati]|nr:unnamed protein product [Trichobilharzia szidati]